MVGIISDGKILIYYFQPRTNPTSQAPREKVDNSYHISLYFYEVRKVVSKKTIHIPVSSGSGRPLGGPPDLWHRPGMPLNAGVGIQPMQPTQRLQHWPQSAHGLELRAGGIFSPQPLLLSPHPRVPPACLASLGSVIFSRPRVHPRKVAARAGGNGHAPCRGSEGPGSATDPLGARGCHPPCQMVLLTTQLDFP